MGGDGGPGAGCGDSCGTACCPPRSLPGKADEGNLCPCPFRCVEELAPGRAQVPGHSSNNTALHFQRLAGETR